MRIVFCSSEVVPFAKTGGMADVCGTLPLSLKKLGQDIAIVMPAYGSVDRNKHSLTEIRENVLQTYVGKDIPVYLLENEKLYGRSGIYGDKSGDYSDNLERFDYYCRSILELFRDLKMPVDIFHCHDWQAGLVPVYLKYKKAGHEFYKNTKTILSLHNLAYQGLFPAEQFKKLAFDQSLYSQIFEFYGKINLLKAGIITADAVATVSPQYAREIQTREFGCGLEGVLRARGESVIGILNGLDEHEWDPRRDRAIECNYSPDNPGPKAENKSALQKKLKLPVKPKVPVFGLVSRLSHQKGLDLINSCLPSIMELDVQLVLLGYGEGKYHDLLQNWAGKYPQKIATVLEFNEDFSHLVYAGSDLFLMPSIYEPCGLSQMISMRYGTVPVVYRVGGLRDTVIPHDQGGNGFVFSEYTPGNFVKIIREATEVYKRPADFKRIIEEGFKANFSWESSARQYIGLYNQCLKNQ